MSLLRQAELCFVNQKTYKALNAFISLPKDHTQAYQEAQRADERQKNGEILQGKLPSTDPTILLTI